MILFIYCFDMNSYLRAQDSVFSSRSSPKGIARRFLAGISNTVLLVTIFSRWFFFSDPIQTDRTWPWTGEWWMASETRWEKDSSCTLGINWQNTYLCHYHPLLNGIRSYRYSGHCCVVVKILVLAWIVILWMIYLTNNLIIMYVT